MTRFKETRANSRVLARSSWLTLVTVLALAAIAAAQEPQEPHRLVDAPKPLTEEEDSLTKKLFKQIEKQGDRLKNSSSNPLLEGGSDPWNDVFQVTRKDNPLVTEECRLHALERMIEITGDKEVVGQHIDDQEDHWKKVKRGEETISLTEYMDHLSECTEVCGPYVAGVLKCHMEGVKKSPHMAVYFDVGRPRKRESDSYRFSYEAEVKLEEFSKKVREDDRSLLILSRASILHKNEDPLKNQHVASRRARAVEQWLLRSGFPSEKIDKKVLVWEPPRLVASYVAEFYELRPDWQDMDNKQFMDQSVVLVAY